MREKIIKAIDNERKRYSKEMKGTQEQMEERYPFLDVFPLKQKATREINERVGGVEEIFMEFVEDGAITEYANTLELFFSGTRIENRKKRKRR